MSIVAQPYTSGCFAEAVLQVAIAVHGRNIYCEPCLVLAVAWFSTYRIGGFLSVYADIIRVICVLKLGATKTTSDFELVPGGFRVRKQFLDSWSDIFADRLLVERFVRTSGDVWFYKLRPIIDVR